MLLAGWRYGDALNHAAEQADAAAALLLAVPSFFLFQAVQSYEHNVVSSMLRGLRFLLFVTALAAFVAAILLVSYDPMVKRPWFALIPSWRTLAIIATVSTVGLWVALGFGSKGPRETTPVQIADSQSSKSLVEVSSETTDWSVEMVDAEMPNLGDLNDEQRFVEAFSELTSLLKSESSYKASPSSAPRVLHRFIQRALQR